MPNTIGKSLAGIASGFADARARRPSRAPIVAVAIGVTREVRRRLAVRRCSGHRRCTMNANFVLCAAPASLHGARRPSRRPLFLLCRNWRPSTTFGGGRKRAAAAAAASTGRRGQPRFPARPGILEQPRGWSRAAGAGRLSLRRRVSKAGPVVWHCSRLAPTALAPRLQSTKPGSQDSFRLRNGAQGVRPSTNTKSVAAAPA